MIPVALAMRRGRRSLSASYLAPTSSGESRFKSATSSRHPSGRRVSIFITLSDPPSASWMDPLPR